MNSPEKNIGLSSVSHHLSDETLLDYSTGSLPTSMETLVACHLTVCSHCRGRSQLSDDVGGQLLASQERVSTKLSAAELLNQSRNMPAISVTKKVNKVGDSSVPRPLGRLLPGPIESLEWRTIAPGIKQFALNNQPRQEGAFKLLRLEPGSVLSPHTHNERELTFVVRGSYQDEVGHFKAGDIADLDSHVEHRPIVGDEEICYALIATDAPVKYTTVLGKIMQPFVGI